MAKKVMATHEVKRTELVAGRFRNFVELRKVEVMAEVKGYAMVRRPGCMPYVAPIKEITKDAP